MYIYMHTHTQFTNEAVAGVTQSGVSKPKSSNRGQLVGPPDLDYNIVSLTDEIISICGKNETGF